MRQFVIQIHPSVLLGLSIALLVLPFRWVMAWLIASLFHELFHILALIFLDEKKIRMAIRLHGAKIITSSLKGMNAIITYCMGPIGGILLLCARQYIPTIATCAFVQSIYNLLPIYPLDGGCIVLEVLKMFNNTIDAWRIMKGINLILLVFLLLLSIIYKSKFLFIIFVIFGFKMIKIRTCKHLDEIVQ